MDELEKEVVRCLLPFLIRNIELGDSDIVESLQQDNIISISDTDNYVNTPHTTREAQVVSLAQLLMHRAPVSGEESLNSLKRALAQDHHFLLPYLDNIMQELEQHRGEGQSNRCLCVHCTLLSHLHDARDVVLSLHEDGYLTDDTFRRLHTPSSSPQTESRAAHIKLLLSALAANQRREFTPVKDNSDPVASLSRALAPKYPQLSRRVLGVTPESLLHCRCRKPQDSSYPGTSVKAQRRRLVKGYKQQIQRDRVSQRQSQRARLSLLNSLMSWRPSRVPPSPKRTEGGPSKQQQRNVRLCIQLDQIINQGNLQNYNQHTQRLLQERPDDVDTAITVCLHNIFAHTCIDYDTQAARENFTELDRLIPLSSCSSYFEVDYLGMQARVYKAEKLTGKVQESLSAAVQKAELLIPERLTSFVFTRYAEFLIHMYKSKLFAACCPQRVMDEIEAYMVGGLRRCQASVEQQLAASDEELCGVSIADAHSSGGRTFVKLAFLYLRSCLEGHMLQQVMIPADSLDSASQCLQRLDVIFPQLPHKMQFHVRMANTDFLLRSAEQNPDTKQRLEGLKQALEITKEAREWNERKNYKSWSAAATRRIGYLEERIKRSPVVAMEEDMGSSQSESLTEEA